MQEAFARVVACERECQCIGKGTFVGANGCVTSHTPTYSVAKMNRKELHKFWTYCFLMIQKTRVSIEMIGPRSIDQIVFRTRPYHRIERRHFFKMENKKCST